MEDKKEIIEKRLNVTWRNYIDEGEIDANYAILTNVDVFFVEERKRTAHFSAIIKYSLDDNAKDSYINGNAFINENHEINIELI
jgi:hypothetical protein